MKEMSFVVKDLEFIYDSKLNNEMFVAFVEIILEKGSLTETLSSSDDFKRYGKNYALYKDRILKEYMDFGSNTFLSQKTYKTILCDVAKKLKVNFNKNQSVELIESRLLEKVLEETFEKMKPEEKEELLKGLATDAKGNYGKIECGREITSALMLAFQLGGFASYKLTVIIANTVAKMILGKGLTFAANAALTKAMSVITGPLGMILVALWTIYDIAGPAYRVTIPCTIMIACMRRELQVREDEIIKLMC